MNVVHKNKLKQFITKLPFGKQALQLIYKIKIHLKYGKYNRQRIHWRSFYDGRIVLDNTIFKKYSLISAEQATVLDIGSGMYLSVPIALYLLGYKHIITMDIKRVAVPEYIKEVIKYYYKHQDYFGIKKKINTDVRINKKNLNQFLLQNYKIDYRAPYDTTRTNIPSNSVDYIVSNNVFEYVHADVLPDIVKEAFRVLRDGGILFIGDVDFTDHRTHLKNPHHLTIYDYLKYSTSEWLEIDQGLQNRLRTSDYLKSFHDAGFEIVEIYKKPVTDADRTAFATIKVHEEFKQKYTDEELMEKGGYFVLRKPIDKKTNQ